MLEATTAKTKDGLLIACPRCAAFKGIHVRLIPQPCGNCQGVKNAPECGTCHGKGESLVSETDATSGRFLYRFDAHKHGLKDCNGSLTIAMMREPTK